ncbi:MAG: hypothetical protein GYA59_03710 [Chloroflexi bacterium]|nr:hypothetical protein [Chloroflexota bacterium]
MRRPLHATLSRLTALRLPPWSLGVMLLWLCFLAYGVLIPWLGLYADDWPFVYVNQLAGWRGVVDFIAWVRPFAAWVFASVSALLGTHFWAMHLLLLLLRALDAGLLFVLLRQVAPDMELPALAAALLCAVFPAFKQEPLALEYSTHFVVLALMLLSMLVMLRAVRGGHTSWPLTLLALLLSLNLFAIEYFVGQEMMRPGLLWRALRPYESDRRRLARRVLLNWLHYLLVFLAFLVWRVFVLKFPFYQPSLLPALKASPFAALLELGRPVAHDLATAALGTWAQIFNLPHGGRLLPITLALILAAFIPALLFLLNWRNAAPQAEGQKRRRAAIGWIAAGLFSMLCAGPPFWVARLPLGLTFPWDRVTLAFMPGVCLVAGGLIALIPGRTWRSLALAVLVGFSVGLHFQNANTYLKESQVLRNFFWQLAWRAPALQPGTVVSLDDSPFNYHVDKFLTPLLNWTYAPGNTSLNTPYAVFDFYKLDERNLKGRPGGSPIEIIYGTLKFHSDTDHLLMVAYDPPGCLRVLSTAEDHPLLLRERFIEELPRSNLALIQPNAAPPARPPDFLGPEPPHDWCYSFEKADLAHQQGQWHEVERLGDEAFQAGFSPRRPSETLVFLEAYARDGRWPEARAMAEIAGQQDFYRPALCQTLHRLEATLPREAPPMELDELLGRYGCRP